MLVSAPATRPSTSSVGKGERRARFELATGRATTPVDTSTLVDPTALWPYTETTSLRPTSARLTRYVLEPETARQVVEQLTQP